MSEDIFTLPDFDGVVRLFPLPNLVLFPRVVQPLHIFEPRYRQMTEHALAGDRLIAMALLRGDWEADYEGSPSIHPVVCIGRILADQRLDDGRFNFLLRGITRARILEELETDNLYRTARVELLAEDPTIRADVRKALQHQLSLLLPQWFSGHEAILEQCRELFESDLPAGALCDVIAFALPLPGEFKQELLEELSVERRLRRLVKHLAKHAPPGSGEERGFPPDFSEN